MIGISLNSNGLGGDNKKGWIKNLIDDYSPMFFGVQETKLEMIDHFLARFLWPPNFMEFAFYCSVGALGGILTLWDSRIFVMEQCIKERNFLGIFETWAGMSSKIGLLNVYAPQSSTSKEAVWRSIESLMNSSNIIWVVFGDFNVVRSPYERNGCLLDVGEACALNDFISRNGLFDFPLCGRRFTRFDKDSKKASKLDRFMVNGTNFRPKPFKIFNKWLSEIGFDELVSSTWASSPSNTRPDISLKDKLKSLWLAMKREEWMMDLNWLEQLRRDDLKQKARLRWAVEGDENTRFFHSTLNNKFANFSIKGILVNGVWVELSNDIKKGALEHFSSRFKEVGLSRPSFRSGMFRKLSFSDASFLDSNFSFDEVKKAMGFRDKWRNWIFSCLSSASISVMINGSSSKEFKMEQGLHQGDPLSPLLFLLIAEALQISIIKACNKGVFDNIRFTLITTDPEKTEKTHTHTLDKCELSSPPWYKYNINKVLQSTSKAEDMGFRDKWRNSIFSCLSSASILVMINGSSSKEFKMEQGLRQGDPLSPLLFLLIAEALQISIIKACNKGVFDNIRFTLITTDPEGLGLKVNISKSRIIGVGVPSSEVKAVAASLGYANDYFPFIYLGLLVDKRMRYRDGWNAVIERFRNKLTCWKAKSLSIGRRLTLIKSILGSLPVYFLSLFKAPQKKEPWCIDGGCLMGAFLRLYAFETDKDCNINDRWMLDNGEWGWSWSWRIPPRGRASNDLETLTSHVGSLNLSMKGMDDWKWSLDSSGSFKVCILSRRIQNIFLAEHSVGNHHLWNSWIPRKVNICVWRASLNRLPTQANLASRGVILEPANCPLCDNIIEDLDHCVMKCLVILPIWQKVWSWWDMVPPVVFPSFTISDIARGIIDPFSNSKIGKIRQGVFQIALWAIWKWRNKIVNASTDTTPKIKEEDIFPTIQRLSRT
ncbi:RNA-directed DNA polymerase, eukaryota [Tanacetum coccineum]